jgi:hypothetical protein
MANLNLIVNESRPQDQEPELIVATDSNMINGLLSDQVVMQWLMDLEAEDSATDLEESRQDMPLRLHA